MSDQSTSAPDKTPKRHFDRHEYYDDLMGGARRKPALPIAGPAVTWHLAFWAPDDLNDPNDPNDPTLKREIWVKTIEKFILALYHRLKDRKLNPYTRSLGKEKKQLYLLNNIYRTTDKTGDSPEPLRTKGATRYQTFRVRFYYGSMPVSVSFELHDEYFTLSTIIDLAWPADVEPTPDEEGDCATIEGLKKDRTAIKRLTKAIKDFNEIAGEHYKQAKLQRSEKDNKPVHRQAFEKPYLNIYHTIWDDFFERIFDCPYKAIKEGRSKLGGVFADFRGFVAAVGEKTFISGPGKYLSKDSLEQRIGIKYFGAREAVHRADVLLPWLKADEGFAQADEAKEPDRTEPVEFTLSLLLRKRALFATALGAQLSRRRGQQGPITYIVLAKNPARWQVGRLIDRLQMLGTLRLAALYNLPHLIRADAQLRNLEDSIKEFMSPPLQGQPQKLEDKLPGWSTTVNEIERQPKDGQADGKTQFAGGLAYRVERSGYYRSQFEGHLDDFRISRIEGFSPFDEAVNRRLAGDYELIRTVGEHHKRLQKILAGLDRRVQTARTHELQQSISEATNKILQLHNQLEKQSEASRNLLAQIKEFQKVGEIGFWAFLFPYYSSSVLIHVAGAIYFTAEQNPLGKENSLEKFPGLELAILLVVIAAGAIGAIRAYCSPKKEQLDDKQPKTVSPVKRTVEGGLA
jgi:hypothetical protein